MFKMSSTIINIKSIKTKQKATANFIMHMLGCSQLHHDHPFSAYIVPGAHARHRQVDDGFPAVGDLPRVAGEDGFHLKHLHPVQAAVVADLAVVGLAHDRPQLDRVVRQRTLDHEQLVGGERIESEVVA